jgi:hypothetical protein
VQVAVLVSAGYGTSNNFGYTDITGSLYSACQGASCSFNIGSIATAQVRCWSWPASMLMKQPSDG